MAVLNNQMVPDCMSEQNMWNDSIIRKLWQFTKLIQKFGHFGIVTPTINHHSGSPFLIFLTWHGICSSKLTFERLFSEDQTILLEVFTPVITGRILLALQKTRYRRLGWARWIFPSEDAKTSRGGDPPVINSNYKVNDRHFFGDIGEFTISLLNWFFPRKNFESSIRWNPLCVVTGVHSFARPIPVYHAMYKG